MVALDARLGLRRARWRTAPHPLGLAAQQVLARGLRVALRHEPRRALLEVIAVAALVRDETAAIELDDAIDDPIEEVTVVGHEHQRRRRLEEPILEPIGDKRIEVVRRLVEEEQLRTRQQQARERHPSPLTAGEIGRIRVEVRQIEGRQGRLDAMLDVVAAEALQLRLQRRKAPHELLEPVSLGGRERRVDGVEVREHTRPVPEPLTHDVADRLRRVELRLLFEVTEAQPAPDAADALIRRVVPGEDAQERALPRAVAAEQADPLAVADLEREPLEEGAVVEAVCVVLEGQPRHGMRGERAAAVWEVRSPARALPKGRGQPG